MPNVSWRHIVRDTSSRPTPNKLQARYLAPPTTEEAKLHVSSLLEALRKADTRVLGPSYTRLVKTAPKTAREHAGGEGRCRKRTNLPRQSPKHTKKSGKRQQTNIEKCSWALLGTVLPVSATGGKERNLRGGGGARRKLHMFSDVMRRTLSLWHVCMLHGKVPRHTDESCGTARANVHTRPGFGGG